MGFSYYFVLEKHIAHTMRLLFVFSLFFAAISAQGFGGLGGGSFCKPAPNKLVTMQWPKNTQDKEAILKKAVDATKKQNEELYAKYTDAELLNLDQLADKFDDKVVKKFEKIAQIRAFK